MVGLVQDKAVNRSIERGIMSNSNLALTVFFAVLVGICLLCVAFYGVADPVEFAGRFKTH